MSEDLTIEEIRTRWMERIPGRLAPEIAFPLGVAKDDVKFLLAKLDEMRTLINHHLDCGGFVHGERDDCVAEIDAAFGAEREKQ